MRDLNLARADGSLRQLLKRLNRIDVLVVDDWAMAPLSEAERRDFWEIAEAVSHSITPAGFAHRRTTSCPKRYYARSFAASSSRLSGRLSKMASCASPKS